MCIKNCACFDVIARSSTKLKGLNRAPQYQITGTIFLASLNWTLHTLSSLYIRFNNFRNNNDLGYLRPTTGHDVCV